MRILGIDPGQRRIGLAISDPLRLTAQGLDTFEMKDVTSLLDHISELFERYDIGEIVVGNPVTQAGTVGRSSRAAQEMVGQLSRAFPVKVRLWDERYSSQEARRVLRGSRTGKGTVDKLAATLILQSYLDFLGGQSEGG
jgi:putative Holliday junction resolvase